MNSTLPFLCTLIAGLSACVPPTPGLSDPAPGAQGSSARQQSGPLSVEVPANWQLNYDAQNGFASLVNSANPNSAIMIFVVPGDPNISAQQLLDQAASNLGQGLVVTLRGGQGNVANLRGTLNDAGQSVAVAMEARSGAEHSFVAVYAGQALVLNQVGGPTALSQIVASARYGAEGAGVTPTAATGPAAAGPAAAVEPLPSAAKEPATPDALASLRDSTAIGGTSAKGKNYTGTWVAGVVFDILDPKPGVVIQVEAIGGRRDARNPGPLLVAIKKHWFTVLPDTSAGYKHMLGSLGLSQDGAQVCVQVMTVDEKEWQVGCVPVAAIQKGKRPFLEANGFRFIFSHYLPQIQQGQREQYCYFENQPVIQRPAACVKGYCDFDPIREIIEYNCNLGGLSPAELNYDNR